MEMIFKVHIKTWKKYEAIYNRHLLGWKSRPLGSIATPEIQALHAKVGKVNGMYAANRLLQLIHSVYAKATGRGFEKPNPASGIRKFREKSRERFLEAHELPAFFEALSKEKNDTVRDYILLSLFTGARRANVCSMRWKDVNLQSKVWHISETKNGTSQRIPLIDEAVEVLKRRLNNQSEFVFPGPGKRGHLAEPRKGWKRILEAANIHNLRLHDLRRSLGSWQAATGANLSVIGKTLNHKNVATTAIYARLNLDPVRSAIETAASAILKAGNLQSVTKVIPFPIKKTGKPKKAS
jgi:integrase